MTLNVYLNGGNSDEGIENVVESFWVIMCNDSDQIYSLGFQGLMTFVYRFGENWYFHQIFTHTGPLRTHTSENKPYWSFFSGEVLRRKVKSSLSIDTLQFDVASSCIVSVLTSICLIGSLLPSFLSKV